MNDHEAIDAINAVLDEWMKGDLSETSALMRIAGISGMNKIEHEESK